MMMNEAPLEMQGNAMNTSEQGHAYIARSHDVMLDKEYVHWVDELGNRYERARNHAVLKVNGEKLLWNWQTGRDLVIRKAEEKWGAGVVEQLSLDLQSRYPGEKGFGTDNLWAMKRWYLFYSEKLERSVQELLCTDNRLHIRQNKQLVEIVREINVTEGVPFPEIFAYVPWGHHVEIIKKSKTVEEAVFYLYQTIEQGWSRTVLQRYMKADLYHRQGKAVTNFSAILPLPQACLAQEMTKENYDFGFLTLPEGYKEEQLEEALCKQMARFLLELGTGFAFVGRQKELVIDGHSRRIDLLFYHIRLRCYVVVELKAVAFQPEFAGKINFYVSAVDDLLKNEDDNPTIGILICSDMNTIEVRYAFRGVNTPIGVATYSDVQIEEMKKQLPTIEQLQERIKLLEFELSKPKSKEE